jgi:CRISPR-associated protein Cas1
LTEKSSMLDFMEPAPDLERQDNHELGAKILSLSSSQARQLEIGRSTLHCLRKRAKSRKSINIYHKIMVKLNGEDTIQWNDPDSSLKKDRSRAMK